MYGKYSIEFERAEKKYFANRKSEYKPALLDEFSNFVFRAKNFTMLRESHPEFPKDFKDCQKLCWVKDSRSFHFWNYTHNFEGKAYISYKKGKKYLNFKYETNYAENFDDCKYLIEWINIMFF